MLRLVSRFVSKSDSDPEPERRPVPAESGVRSYKGRSVDSIYCSQKDRPECESGEAAGTADEAVEDGVGS